jgi:Fic family protein
VLRDPVLYLSLYFKTHRSAYYERLQVVRELGDWEGWLDFFLTGVVETATRATDTARRILAIFEADRRSIEALGRPAASALRVHQLLQTKPLITIPSAANALALSRPTITVSLAHLERAGIVRKTTGRQRGRAFAYDRYLALLNEGTEPIRR